MTEQEAISRMVAPRDRRPHIWRQGVLQIWVTRACDKACFGCTQGSNLSFQGQRPVMITPEQFDTACQSLQGYFGVVGMFGGNPCHAAGTLVYTSAGVFPIESLEGKVFQVRNLRGELQPATCWLSGRSQPLYEVKLRGGHSYFATADHEWPALKLASAANSKRKDLLGYSPRKQAVPLGKLKTVELKPGMRLPIVLADSLDFGCDGDADDGFLAGWALGDGWLTRGRARQQRLRRDGQPDRRNWRPGRDRLTDKVGLIVNKQDRRSGISAKLSQRLRKLGSKANWRAVKRCYELNAMSEGLDAWLEKFGVLGKHEGLPAATWTTASEAFRKGLLDGLFSSDGYVEVSRKGFGRIRLTSAHEKLIRDVSALLGFYGIKTQISSRTRAGSFPNGKDYGKKYVSFELSVSNALSIERFARLFPLTHKVKNERLQSLLGRHKTDDVESTNIEIVSVELTDRCEDVWDISVSDDTHCFQLAHCVTGNCLHPQFDELCAIMRKRIPRAQRGIWCNHPRGKGAVMRATFNPAVSNLNVHLDQEAYDEFKRDWPESKVKGLTDDSRHSPPFVAMKDMDELQMPDGRIVPNSESARWELISRCDINRNWSSLIGVFRGELRAWFCEIAGAQAMLHQYNPLYPDTGVEVTPGWWNRGMEAFAHQVRHHCHDCGIPLRGYGELAVQGKVEQVSITHQVIYQPKDKNREVQVVSRREEIKDQALPRATDYIENSAR